MSAPDPFAQFGLTPLVNVSGTETVKGASPVLPEIMGPVNALVAHSVDMIELQSAACRVIAEAFGSEAGIVVNSTAAGITIAIAACMTGEDPGAIERLPHTTGLKNEVILQRGHYVNYGCAITQNIALSGAKPVGIGVATECGGYALAAAINAQTAAALYVVSHHTVQCGLIDLAAFCRICREHGVPVIVDAAAEADPTLFLRAGGDLVLTSMHKQFGSLTAATIAGRLDLVRACLLQQRGIGRMMKVGKEGIIAAMTAIARWRAVDRSVVSAARTGRLQRAKDRLDRLPGLTATLQLDTTSRQFHRLAVEVDPTRTGFTAFGLASALATRRPSIYVRSLSAELGILELDFRQVSDETAALVVDAFEKVLTEPARPPGDEKSAHPNLADSGLAKLLLFPLPPGPAKEPSRH